MKCSTCKEDLSLDKFPYNARFKSSARCKSCFNTFKGNKSTRIAISRDLKKKMCTRCFKVKDSLDFYKRENGNLFSECKACFIARMKARKKDCYEF